MSANMNLVQFSDPKTPKHYTPFNVFDIGGLVVVTFAKQDIPPGTTMWLAKVTG